MFTEVCACQSHRTSRAVYVTNLHNDSVYVRVTLDTQSMYHGTPHKASLSLYSAVLLSC